MKQSIRKFISSAVTVTTALSMTGASLVAQVAHGAQLTNASASLSVVTPAAQSNYTIAFKGATSALVKGIKIQFSNTGDGGGAVPAHLVTDTGATLAATNGVTVSAADVTSDWTPSFATNGVIALTNSTGTQINATVPVTVLVNGIKNNDFDFSSTTKCDAATDSDSCWIQITTYNNTDLASNHINDSTIVTYTIVKSVQVTATVDPILKFTVSAVASGAVKTNDTHVYASDTTAVETTSTSTAIQFGHVTVGKAKVGQQDLQVLTNANNGYYVYQKFVNASGNAMNGSAVSTNKIDPYIGSAHTTTWGSPSAWTADPNGSTTNTNTGWIGLRTSDTRIGGFTGDDTYGPPVVDNGGQNSTSTGNAVVHSTSPDDGTAHYFVTYKIRVNAFQPADSYSGTSVYNVVATY